MKNALAALLVISLCISLGMNYSLWQQWAAWAPEKTRWTNNEWAWYTRENDQEDYSAGLLKGQSEIAASCRIWLEKAETYLREQKLENQLRKRRHDASEKLREAGIER